MIDRNLILTFWFTHVAVLVIPGNNVLLVMAYGLTGSRRHASLCALGVTTGTVVWCAAATQGLALLLQSMQGVEPILAMFAAAYLFYVGWNLFRANRGGALSAPSEARSPYVSGLVSSVTNLKSGVFFASAFAVVLAVRPELAFALGGIAVLNSLAWHLLLALFFSTFAFILRPEYVQNMKVMSGAVVCLIALLTLVRALL